MQKLLVFLFLFISFNSFSQQLLKDIGEGNDNTFYKNHEEYITEAFNDSLFVVKKKVDFASSESLFIVKNGLDTVYNYPISGIQFNNIFFIKKEGGLLFIGDADNFNYFKLYCIKPDGSYEILVNAFYSSLNTIKFFKIQNTLVFTINNGSTSFYRTNGTSSGTVNFQIMSSVDEIFKFNDKLYFKGYDNTSGYELWVLETPTSSPIVLKDIRNGSESSNPAGFKVDSDKFYFNALVDQNSSNYFYGLFESDGTNSGTQLIYPQPYTDGGFNASQIIKKNNLIYYSRYNNVDVIDKTTLTRTILFNGDRGMFKSFILNNEVYGILRSANPLGKDDFELWKLGPTQGECVKIKTISSRVWFSYIKIFEATNNKIYIELNSIYDYPKNDGNVVIWLSDGTETGTVKLSDLNPNVITKNNTGSIGLINNTFYFNSIIKPYGYELGRSNGTSATLVCDLNKKIFSSYPTSFFEFGPNVYFMANNNEDGRELWETNGTVSGTNLKFDLTKRTTTLPYSNTANTKFDFGILGDDLIYYSPQELRINKYNRISNEIVTLKTQSFTSQGFKKEFTKLNDKLIFSENFSGYGYELGVTDGSTGGTFMLKDINVGFGNSLPLKFTEFNGFIYFFAQEYGNNFSLWRTDATSEGTQKIYDFNFGIQFILERELVKFNNKLYFTSYNSSNYQYELWTLDASGVQNISTFGFSYKPVIFNNSLYYLNQNSLFKIDVNNSISLVWTFSFNPQSLSVFNNEIYVKISEPNGYKIYKTDGTSNYLTLVNTNMDSNEFVKLNDNLSLIVGTNNALDYINYVFELKLYKADGTLIDLIKNPYSIQKIGYNFWPQEYFIKDQKVYFWAPDNTLGYEPWVLDFSCPNSITLSSPISITQAHRSGNTIQLSSNVSSNLNIEANNNIVINPGTNIQQGTVFKAEIKGCN